MIKQLFFFSLFFFFLLSHIEQSTGKNKLFTGRKTWEQSTPIKKRDIQKADQSQLPSSYTSPEIPRDVPSSELAASCHPYATSPIHSGSPAVADVLKIPSCPTKKQDLSSNGYLCLSFNYIYFLVVPAEIFAGRLKYLLFSFVPNLKYGTSRAKDSLNFSCLLKSQTQAKLKK